MKELINFLHFLVLIYSLAWSQLASADARTAKGVKKVSLTAFVLQFESDFHRSIKDFNSDRKDLTALLKSMRPAERKFLLHHYRMNRISTLPKWKPNAEGYELSYQGNKVFYSPRLAYQSKFWINGKIYTIKSRDLESEKKRFYKFLNSPKKFSFLNLFINEAEAGICGGICIAILFGVVITAGLKVFDGGMDTLLGDTDSLDKLYGALQEKSGQCTQDVRAMHFRRDSTTPGEQETFDDFKKLESHIKTDSYYGHKDLHSYVLKEVIGINVNSCEEFAQLWKKKSGALAMRNNGSSIGAQERATAGEKRREEEVCKVVERYSECITNYKKKELTYDGKRRGGESYREDTGLFRERTWKEKALDAIGK